MTGYAIIPSREGRRGRVPLLDDAAFRTRLIALAATGISRRGVANLAGVSASTLCEWLARGRAEPVDPWRSFASEYCAAERLPESLGTMIQAKYLAHLSKLPASELKPGDLQWVANLLASQYPEAHGTSAHHRKPDPEPDGAAWLDREAMTKAQLTVLLSDPPESISAALLEVGDTVVANLLAGGWAPSPELLAELKAARKTLTNKDPKP